MRKHGMKARVAEIKAENAAKCEMSKEEYRAYLIAAMKTPAGQIGPDHQFCQIYKVVDENGVTVSSVCRTSSASPTPCATLRLGRTDQSRT